MQIVMTSASNGQEPEAATARCLRPPAVAVRPATVANRSTSGSTLVRQGLIRDDYDNPRADLGAPTDAAVLAQGALRFLSPPT